MRIKIRNFTRQSGTVLVITIVLMAILGVTLGGYLYWVRTQNFLVAQSQAWNHALAMAEAGVEDAMSQINWRFGTNYVTNARLNWGGSGNVFGPRSNSLPGGAYSTIIIGGEPGPTIISTGYVTVPIMGQPVVRTVRVTTKAAAAFGNGVNALQNIVFKGNNVAVDSYDSTDPLHSTNGLYYAPWRKAGGDIASTYGIVEINNANVNGKVRTGPEGSYSVGVNGFAGDLNFFGPGIQDGWYSDDFNMEMKDVSPPDTTGYVIPTGSGIPGDTNKFILGSGGYIISGDLVLRSSETLLVRGNATLYVGGEIQMNGMLCSIIIEPSASLKIYAAGANNNLGKVNVLGNAYSFQYYGLPSNTSLTWSGNDTYLGCIYAPQADFVCGGGGSTVYDYQGACNVRSITMNGHFKIHYDEALARIGPKSGFVAASWTEL